MENYYEILGVPSGANVASIKRAFREKAKRSHPDLAGEAGQAEIRRVLAAYETLSDPERRAAYDRAYDRFVISNPRWRGGIDFDYRAFLKERVDDPKSQAVLIFFDLLHMEEEDAMSTWRSQGGLDFAMERYLDREDWMDCAFILAEELDKAGDPYAACSLLFDILKEEKKKPYFKHFAPEVDALLKSIIRTRLVGHCDDEAALECLDRALGMGLGKRDEARYLKMAAEIFDRLGDVAAARVALRDAIQRDPALPNAVQIRRRLGV